MSSSQGRPAANPISQADQRAFISNHLWSLPLRFAEPITIGVHHNEVGFERAWMRSATVTALDLGGCRRIVMNQHVLKLYRDAVAANSTGGAVRVQIGSTPIDLKSVLLDENEASDLAVLDATDLDLRRDEMPDMVNALMLGTGWIDDAYVPLQFHTPSPWPATDIKSDDAILLGGYPEFLRERNGMDVTHASWSMAGIPITGEGFDEFRVRFDRSRWQNQFGKSDEPLLLTKQLSGLSGSPVFVERLAEGGWICSLVGFVKAYDPDGDLLIVTSATNIRSDGSLKRRRAPIILGEHGDVS